MARGAAGERLAQLEVAIAQLGARLRRLEESSSARALALEQRLEQLEYSLARAYDGATPCGEALLSRHEHGDAHAHAGRARSMRSLLYANGISLSKDISMPTLPSPNNGAENYFISIDETNHSSVAPGRRSSELVQTAGRVVVQEQQRRLVYGALPRARHALQDKGLPLAARVCHDLDVAHGGGGGGGGGHTRLHAAARWDPVVAAADLLLLKGASSAVLDGGDRASFSLHKNNAPAQVLAAYW